MNPTHTWASNESHPLNGISKNMLPLTKLKKHKVQTYHCHMSPCIKKIKIFNTIIQTGIKYAFYTTPFSILEITKLDKHLINPSITSPLVLQIPILAQLPQDKFGLNAYFLLPQYATTLAEN